MVAQSDASAPVTGGPAATSCGAAQGRSPARGDRGPESPGTRSRNHRRTVIGEHGGKAAGLRSVSRGRTAGAQAEQRTSSQRQRQRWRRRSGSSGPAARSRTWRARWGRWGLLPLPTHPRSMSAAPCSARCPPGQPSWVAGRLGAELAVRYSGAVCPTCAAASGGRRASERFPSNAIEVSRCALPRKASAVGCPADRGVVRLQSRGGCDDSPGALSPRLQQLLPVANLT